MSEIPEDIMRAAADACRKHGVAPMGVPFVPSEACLIAITAIMVERDRDQWQPIETAPKDGSRFLAVHERAGVVNVTWFGKTSHVPLYGWCIGDDAEDIGLWTPTHWHTIPAFSASAIRSERAGE